ncbi:MAG: rhombosortase [Acidobacteria bacterium]|nr:rhombosortase [Acidobacteriota bacterium]
MVSKNPEAIGRQVPVVTLLMAAGALAVYVLPGLASQMVYDRTAILSGEVWRLLTGNWVHFSPSHLLYDLLALGLAGWIIERRGYPSFGPFCVLSALGIGTVLLAVRPEVQAYGGLSGVATGAIVYLALHGLKEPGPWRWICTAALVLTVGKVLLESMTGRLTFAAAGSVSFVPLPLSHVVGGLTASFIFWWSSARKTCPESRTRPA